MHPGSHGLARPVVDAYTRGGGRSIPWWYGKSWYQLRMSEVVVAHLILARARARARVRLSIGHGMILGLSTAPLDNHRVQE